MAHYPCNAGRKQWGGPWRGMFTPTGPLHKLDTSGELGKITTYAETVTGRIIVGFNVDGTPRWTLNDLIPIVRDVRMQQAGTPDASFLAQHGLYQHSDPDNKGLVVEEQGAQVIIINLSGASLSEFEAQIIALSEIIAVRLAQKAVIVDIQVNGVIQRTHVVEP